MWLHMNKAHGLRPERMKFSHDVSKLNRGRIEWISLIDRRRELVHRGIYVDLATLDTGYSKAGDASEEQDRESAGKADGNEHRPFCDPDPWSAKALQELYGTRARSNPML